MILISGGTGFIGRALTKALLAKSHQVCVLTRQTKLSDPVDGAGYIIHDFSEPGMASDLHSRVQGAKVFIHLAADINWNTDFSPEVYDSFRLNVVNVIRFIQNISSSLEKVILGSSIMVYPMVGNQPFIEDKDEDPDNFYGTNKLVLEDAFSLLSVISGFQFLSARIGQVYGPRMRVNRILIDTIKKAQNGDEIFLFGDGSTATDWIYIDDVVDGLTKMIDYQGSGSFNIGSGSITDNTTLARTCVELESSESKITYLPEKIIPMRKQLMDLSKSNELLSYVPKYDFALGVATMLKTMSGWEQ